METSKKYSSEDYVGYKVYPERWWILASIFTLFISAGSHIAAFPSVSYKAAKHYDQSGEMIDLLPTASHGSRTIGLVIAIFVAKKSGLKLFIFIGGSLIFIGKISLITVQLHIVY